MEPRKVWRTWRTSPRPWQVLDAAYDAEKATEGEPYVLCIEVQDVPGVLNQVGSGGALRLCCAWNVEAWVSGILPMASSWGLGRRARRAAGWTPG